MQCHVCPPVLETLALQACNRPCSGAVSPGSTIASIASFIIHLCAGERIPFPSTYTSLLDSMGRQACKNKLLSFLIKNNIPEQIFNIFNYICISMLERFKSCYLDTLALIQPSTQAGVSTCTRVEWNTKKRALFT